MQRQNEFQEKSNANLHNLSPLMHVSDTCQMHLRGTIGERVECLMQCITVLVMHRR
jgi:hypothetical protein